MKVQTSTEVSQEEFRKIMKANPDGELGYAGPTGEVCTYTLSDGIQYYTSIFGLNIADA